jgi:hypothetical protein
MMRTGVPGFWLGRVILGCTVVLGGCAVAGHHTIGCRDCHYCRRAPLPYSDYCPPVCHSDLALKILHSSSRSPLVAAPVHSDESNASESAREGR